MISGPGARLAKRQRVCATDDGRQEQDTMLYTVMRRGDIYNRSVLELEYANICARRHSTFYTVDRVFSAL